VRSIKADLEPAVFRYDQIDDRGRVFQADNLRSPNPRPNLQYPLPHPTTGRPVKMHPNGWVYSPETMDAMIADGRIIFGPDETTSPRMKRFLSEQSDRVPYPTFTQARMPGSKKLDGLRAAGAPGLRRVFSLRIRLAASLLIALGLTVLVLAVGSVLI